MARQAAAGGGGVAVLLVHLVVSSLWQKGVIGAITSFEFYMHDNFNITPITVVQVAGPRNITSTSSSFGAVQVIDDPLTDGPLLSSNLIGRGQGAYFSSQLDGNSLLLTFTAVFTTGSNNGSTLCFHGADKFTDATREIAVIGGTGKFRMARGYAVMVTTSNTNLSTILHFNVTVDV